MSATSNFDRRGAYATQRRGGIDAWEMAFIDQKRGEGVSDFAIANMLARPKSEIEAHHRVRLAALVIVPDEPEPAPAPDPKPTPPRKPTVTRSRKRMGPRGMPRRIQTLVEQVAARHDLTLADLLGDARTARVAHARHEAFAYIYQFRKPTTQQHLYSLQRIGAWFGGRDHTTVRFGVKAHWDREGAGLVP